MKIKTKVLDKKWFTYKDGDDVAQFQVRPFPFSNIKMDADELILHLWEQFDYCLVGWKDIDDDGTPYEYNDDNKKKLFDFYEHIREFVFSKAKELGEATQKELKNS